MEGRKLKDHIIQLYQSIKQVLSNDERQFLYKSLREYKGCHDTDRLALQLCRLCTSSENVEIVRFVWTEIIHGQSAEFDQILKEYPVEQFQNQQIILKADNLRRKIPLKSHTGRLFDEDGPTGNLHLIKIHKSEDNNIGFCIRGGLEHGLGVYVSGVDKGSAAEESTLQIGDKILEANNISLQRLPSSSAVKVLTGSNQLKLLVERTGMIPEWRYDCQMKKVTTGEYEEYSAANYFRGIDVDIPERCVTSSNVTDEEDLGLNIRGGNEYRLGIYVSMCKLKLISHAYTVETLNSDTHLIITLRDVGRFPVYKEIYAEYTWTGTSAPEGTGSIYGGEKLIERKLPDTWIEPDGHKKRKSLHLRVPVEVISAHDQHDGTDPLRSQMYLPEGEEISHGYQHGSSSNSESHSLIRSDSIDMKPVDTWIRGSGHTNPTFQPDDMGDNSSASSGTYGEYTVSMEDIIAKNHNRKLNIYESTHHESEDNVDGGSVKDSGRKSVERYIFDNDLESLAGTGSKQGSVRLDVNEDDIRSETISRRSLDIDDNDSQNYLSSPSFSSFTQNFKQNKMISLTDWKQSVESLVPHMEADSTELRESHSDNIDKKSDQSSSDDNEKEENFAISIVPGTAFITNVKESTL
ncbi:PDZD7 [Mytilus edulis]|uniref:PDZD7 n=1 Tax=Mytilus edulis TaxID=6550 RepID=A0A8S3SZ49_MYTED|nr:PDZD7 [Mytilus edulis]